VGAESLLGLALLREGSAEEAIPHLEAYVERRPDDARGYNNLGAALSRTGRGEEAREAFREALRLDPSHAGARLNLERLDGRSEPDRPSSPFRAGVEPAATPTPRLRARVKRRRPGRPARCACRGSGGGRA
jgi:tetratricopeptide (TPR) repeat protein